MQPRSSPNRNPYLVNAADYGIRPEEKEQIILRYSEMVKFMAIRLLARLPDHVSVDDLFSAGIIGLIDAVDKYDAEQGIPFECYAKIRVRGAMLDEIRSMDWIPRSLRQKCNVLEKTCSSLEQRLGRYPSDEEIADELQVDLGEYHRMLDETKGISLLPESIHETSCENKEFSFLATDTDELFQQTYRHEIQKYLAEAIGGLAEKEQLVLSLYYYDELTMKEIGAALGYTESRISQIHTKAVLKLRTRLAKKLTREDLPSYLDTPETGYRMRNAQ